MEFGLSLIVKMLIDNGANYHKYLLRSVLENEKEFVEILLENGVPM